MGGQLKAPDADGQAIVLGEKCRLIGRGEHGENILPIAARQEILRAEIQQHRLPLQPQITRLRKESRLQVEHFLLGVMNGVAAARKFPSIIC